MASYSTGPLPVATHDAYVDASVQSGPTLLCQGAGQAVITVSTAAVVFNIGHGGGGSSAWEAIEHFLVPGVWPIKSQQLGIDAIRLRSAAAGVPANVAISAYG